MKNFKYIIRELKVEDLNPKRGFLQTLSNLSEVGKVSEKEAKKIFKEMKKEKSYIFVAVDGNKDIIGTIKLMVEQKFYHQGAKAGHIEDVITRKGFENMGVAGSLIKKALGQARKFGCYKVILDCRDELIPFYKKFRFYKFENCLRVNLKR